MRRLFVLGLGMAVISYVACGGTAVVDGQSDQGGAGGSSSNANGGSNPNGPVTVTTTGTMPTTMSGPTTTSGPGDCLLAGVPDFCQDCIEAECEPVLNECCNTKGCIELLNCVVENCGGLGDIACVVTNCADEVDDAGGVSGAGTSLAQEFAACAEFQCGCPPA